VKKSLVTTIVAIGIGAALFFVLGRFVAIPSPVPNTNISLQYGLLAFMAALFGPVAGVLIGFIGHALIDFSFGWGIWWSWVIASGISCFVVGLVYPRLKVDEGQFSWKEVILFNVFQLIANAFAWIVVAPVLDIVIYGEPANLVFTQGAVAALSNAVCMGVIGTLLLFLYSKTRSGKGTLSKE
jgi:Predicted membrane protein